MLCQRVVLPQNGFLCIVDAFCYSYRELRLGKSLIRAYGIKSRRWPFLGKLCFQRISPSALIVLKEKVRKRREGPGPSRRFLTFLKFIGPMNFALCLISMPPATFYHSCITFITLSAKHPCWHAPEDACSKSEHPRQNITPVPFFSLPLSV